MNTVTQAKPQIILNHLENQLVNTKYGLIQTLQTHFPYPGEPPIYTAKVRLSDHSEQFGLAPRRVGGSGAALDETRARLSALCECIERYCLNAATMDVIVDCYTNLSQSFAVLSPDQCPLFHSEQYPTVGYSPFTSQTNIAWTWAINLPQGTPVLVPADFVYLRYPTTPEVNRLMSMISTGAACGSSATDAIVRGIYEIVERDAMMLMWLNKYPCPRLLVDPESNLGQFMHRYLRLTSVTAHLFWLTNDLQIPACMAVLIEGKPGDQQIFVGLSAHLNPEQAATKALLEAFEVRLSIFDMDESKEPLAAPQNITSIHKHAIYYVQQDRTHLLDFLLNTPHTIPLASIPDKSAGVPETDLQTCLEYCRIAKQAVFAVDLTKEDIYPTGLRVVRVIMPGMQQLTTNHNHPFLGNPRLFNVPVHLGWRNTPLAHTKINQDPHPFI